MSTGDGVPSPCVNVCRMDEASGLCTGCLRTIDEIAAWSTLPDAARREVWRLLAARRAQAAAAAGCAQAAAAAGYAQAAAAAGCDQTAAAAEPRR